jgi:flagellar hook assembly protein FlgD
MTDAPLSFGLSAGRPNPFREGTTLEYALPAADVVDIAVYDAAGRLVRRLANGPQSPGVHEVRWNGRNDSGVSVGSGVYFLRVRAGSQALLRKLVLVN